METAALSTAAIALWHALMAVNNACFWAEKFTVASKVLEIKTGLSRTGVYRAREELQEKGLLKFKAGKAREEAALYRLMFLYETKNVTINKTETKTKTKTKTILHVL
jgi:hypothetical protein